MLSILIPVYNFDVTAMVYELHRQGEELGFAFEVLLFDDHSKDAYLTQYPELSNLMAVQFHRMEHNVGRSKIRNLLARSAQYDYLLFLDCDAKIVSKDFLKTYIANLEEDILLYGGRVYQDKPPTDAQYKLHWLFGKSREEKSANQRGVQPWHSFMTNNYVIPKKIQLAFPFEERLHQYGHEDTLFGLQLQEAGYSIRHLDNPVEHIGLESAAVFLEKSKKAIENLAFIAKEYPTMETKLLKTGNRLQRWRLDRAFKKIYQLRQKKWESNLLSDKPDLTLFDLWKLGQLMEHDQ